MSASSELLGRVASLHIADDSVFPLLDLPELIRNGVLGFLRVWELMDLRLVCKATKEWVEQSHLDNFMLCIKSHPQIEAISAADSNPGWSAVRILCDSEMHNQDWIQNPLYLNLLQRLAPSLSNLVLEGHRVPHTGLLSILSTCTGLKRLEMGILDCKNWSEDFITDDKAVKSNLNNLEHLSIEYLAWNEEQELELFQKIISQCKSLTTLKAPHILMASLFKIGETDDEDSDQKYLELVMRRMVTPLVDYLTRRSVSDKSMGRNFLQQLNVENLHHTEVFPVLVSTCHQVNIRLLNLSEAFEGPVPTTQLPFVEAIESLNGFTNHLDFHRLVNLKKIKLDTDTSADSAVAHNSIDAELPKLAVIELNLPEDIDTSILKCLLKQPRPSVKSLKIEFEVEEPSLTNLFQVADLVNNFKNLQELSFIQWDGNDSDLITLLKHLPRLRSLRLQICTKITDKGLLGEDTSNPTHSNLKELKNLWLDCCISDAVLQNFVSQLSLEEFFYSSGQVTTSGLKALADGPFAKSIIIFKGIQPDGCSDKEFEKVLKRFKNLKRTPTRFN